MSSNCSEGMKHCVQFYSYDSSAIYCWVHSVSTCFSYWFDAQLVTELLSLLSIRHIAFHTNKLSGGKISLVLSTIENYFNCQDIAKKGKINYRKLLTIQSFCFAPLLCTRLAKLKLLFPSSLGVP